MLRIRSASREDIREHRAAKTELARVTRRDRTETPAYHTANQRVITAEQRVSSFRR